MNDMHLPRSPRRGDFLDVTIGEIDPAHGAGAGHLNITLGPQAEPRRLKVLVPKSVPGDRVRVEVLRYKNKRVEGRIAEVLEPSPMRSAPRCQHFGGYDGKGRGCGGCTIQSLDYRHQLLVKEQLTTKLVQDAGLDPGLVAPVTGMDEPWFYRNKMEFSFGIHDDGTYGVGLHPSGYKFEVLDLQACYLLNEETPALLAAVRAWIRAENIPPYHFKRGDGWLRQLMVREGKRTGESMIELMTSHDEEVAGRTAVDLAASFARLVELFGFTSVYWTQHRAVRGERTRQDAHLLAGNPTMREEMHLPGDHTLSFDIHPRAFFQPNTLQAERLYARVVERAALDGTPRLLDLYCGTGTIGLALAPWASSVVGVEMQPDAVENARHNAKTNGIEHVEFICGDVGKVLEETPLSADVIVVDPPRAGLMSQALEHIDAIADAHRLVYVSCNPRALARDLVELHKRGWNTRSIEPMDMFPHTYHIENVALLERK